MKHYLILIMLLSGFSALSQNGSSPTGRIVYRVTSGFKAQYIEMFFSGTNYVYRITDEWDTSINRFSLHKAQAEIDELSTIQEKNRYIARHTFTQGKVGSNLITIASPLRAAEKTCMIDTIPRIEWKLTDKTDTISGKVCFVAEGFDEKSGSTFIAAYDPSIPTAAAPLQLQGLPGLLLQVHSKNSGRKIEMVQLNFPTKSDERLVDLCDGNKLITREQLKQQTAERQVLFDKLKNGEINNLGELRKD